MNRAKNSWSKVDVSMRELGFAALLASAASVLPGCSSQEDGGAEWPAGERELVAKEQYALLNEGAVPIDEAMASLSKRGRLGHPSIEPRASEDFSASQGWSYGGNTVVSTADVAMPVECQSATDPMACWGEKIRAQQGCLACHAVDGVLQQPGPNWKGLFGKERVLTGGETVTADEEYIRSAIVDPWGQLVEGYGRVMPPQNLQEPEIEAVIAYIKSLGTS